MNKSIYQKLHVRVEEVAKTFSDPNRSLNYNGETFKYDDVVVTSETTAFVTMKKSSGKKVGVGFVWVNTGAGGFWSYFFPTDSHLLGLRYWEKYKLEIERFNQDIE